MMMAPIERKMGKMAVNAQYQNMIQNSMKPLVIELYNKEKQLMFQNKRNNLMFKNISIIKLLRKWH